MFLSTDPAILHTHAGDAWFAAQIPEAVLFADSATTVARALQFAHRHKIPVTARGAGRGYVGGCVPTQKGLVISLMKMNRILELNPEDGVAVVQPGVITATLQKKVKQRGFFYPPDPASLKECSLGGNVATNAGGPRCLKYGVTRNYILGLQIALANGSLVRVGGRTHKNKCGFDLVGLFVGSEGMLGIVTEITVRIIPHPPSRAVLSASFANPKIAAATVQAIFAHGILPSALELADNLTLNAARLHLGANLIPQGQAHLLVELDGQPDAVRHEMKSLQALVKKQGALSLTIAHTEEGCENLWQLRRQFSTSLKATGLTKLNEDIVVPRSRLVDLFRFAEQLQKKYKIQVACFGHAGDGNIHVNLMLTAEQLKNPRFGEKALDELFRQIITWNGSITGEHGIGLAKKRWWPQATSPELRQLHKTLKTALDSQGILNPGKFI